MVDIMRTMVVLYISYNPASCHRVRLDKVNDINWGPFQPNLSFLFKHIVPKQTYYSLMLKHDNKLASKCTSTMADLNYCILDDSYTAVHVFVNQKVVQNCKQPARFSLLYRLSLFITRMLAIIE